MNRQEFNSGMATVLAFYAVPKTPADREQMDRYMTALYGSVGHINSVDFHEIVKRLTGRLSGMKRPMPGDILGLYRELRGEVKQTKGTCSACGGIGMVFVNLYRAKTGETKRFAKPCGSCQPRHERLHAGLPDGWTETDSAAVPAPDFSTLKIRPDHAKLLLGIADKSHIAVSDAVAECLVRNAGGEGHDANCCKPMATREEKDEAKAVTKRNKMVADFAAHDCAARKEEAMDGR